MGRMDFIEELERIKEALFQVDLAILSFEEKLTSRGSPVLRLVKAGGGARLADDSVPGFGRDLPEKPEEL